MSTLVDVLVPVLGRPHNARPFMESLGTETRVKVWVIGEFSDPDTCAAWRELDCNVIVHPTAHTFAEKVNAGYPFGTAPFVLLVGDDCRFTDGWLDQAMGTASLSRAAVIGTNDESNRRVVRGSHTCHPIIRRSYIDFTGASWDGPGIVCHEGYRHNYVDDELVTVAKQRGVWVFSPKCVIRHLHPVWGTAENDATYRHGNEHRDADRALFNSRRERYAS
jgi:hypothetical protein